MATTNTGAARTLDKTRMEVLLDELGQRVDGLEQAVTETEAVSVRLNGAEEPKTGQAVGNRPSRPALLGSLDDLSDRVSGAAARLRDANNRINALV